ncbi:MAG: hypothetical protein ACYCSP_12005 [Acidobacteriaceae bacterium]
MSSGIFNKLGRALSIFGVSSPDDIRRMQTKKIPPDSAKPAPSGSAQSSAGDPPPQEKRTDEE